MIKLFSEIINEEADLTKLQNDVNDFLTKNPTSTIQWLQSSSATRHYSYTQLTAIITVPSAK